MPAVELDADQRCADEEGEEAVEDEAVHEAGVGLGQDAALAEGVEQQAAQAPADLVGPGGARGRPMRHRRTRVHRPYTTTMPHRITTTQ